MVCFRCSIGNGHELTIINPNRKSRSTFSKQIRTVDERNPAPLGMYKTLCHVFAEHIMFHNVNGSYGPKRVGLTRMRLMSQKALRLHFWCLGLPPNLVSWERKLVVGSGAGSESSLKPQ